MNLLRAPFILRKVVLGRTWSHTEVYLDESWIPCGGSVKGWATLAVLNTRADLGLVTQGLPPAVWAVEQGLVQNTSAQASTR